MLKSELRPLYTFAEGSLGWRITTPCGNVYHAPSNRDFRFARKVDCELAIQAFADAGFDTDAKLGSISDPEFLRIACSYLQW